MPERGARSPAGDWSEIVNLGEIGEETGLSGKLQNRRAMLETSRSLREELRAKGLRGFKRGGKVKKTGPAKLHKGERVLTAKTAKKVTPAKLRAAIRKPAPKRRPRR